MAYVQRTTISVAAPELTATLQYSTQQIGWLFFAFTTAYALSQLPGGALGQRLGPRVMFTVVGIIGVIAGMLVFRHKTAKRSFQIKLAFAFALFLVLAFLFLKP